MAMVFSGGMCLLSIWGHSFVLFLQYEELGKYDEFEASAWISVEWSLIDLNGMCRVILGSVSEYCCENAVCPVVVANKKVCNNILP